MLVFALSIVFIFVLVLSLLEEDEDSIHLKWAYCGILFILILLVGFRPVGIDNDSPNYVTYYESAGVGMVELVEPTFSIISEFARLFDSPRLIFIIYALLAIPLKGYAITKMTPMWFLALAIWMNNYMLLHEFTQIRTAVAAALFLYGLYFLKDQRRWTYLGLCLAAVTFHYSALLLLPLAILGTQPLNKLWRFFLIIAPLFCYAVCLKGFDPMSMIPIPLFQEKLEIYEHLRDSGATEALNVFNTMALFRLGAYYFILWKSHEIYKSYPSIYLMLKIMGMSICCYAFFANMPALGVRTSELLGVIDILILPTMVYAVKPEWVVKLVLVIVCIGLFSLNIFRNGLLLLEV